MAPDELPMLASQGGAVLCMLADDLEILTRLDCRDMVVKNEFLEAKQKAVEGICALLTLFAEDLRRTAMRTIDEGRTELK